MVLCRAKERRFEVVEALIDDDVAAEPVIKRPSRRRDAVGLSSSSVESTTARSCGNIDKAAVQAAAEGLLRSRFEHEDFREGQFEAIVSVMDKNNPNVGVLSLVGTGQGKVRHATRADPGGISFSSLKDLFPRLDSIIREFLPDRFPSHRDRAWVAQPDRRSVRRGMRCRIRRRSRNRSHAVAISET